MNTEPELLNERLERLAIVLDEIMPQCALLVRDAITLLKEQETANVYKCKNCGTWVSAENVVRCKDCKNHECTDMYGDWVCEIDGSHRSPDWFCADGEAKE